MHRSPRFGLDHEHGGGTGRLDHRKNLVPVLETIRRIGKNQRGIDEFLAQAQCTGRNHVADDVERDDPGHVADAERVDVSLQHTESATITFHECAARRTARQRLDAERARAREEVDDHGTIDAPLLEDPRTFSVRVVDHPDAREAVTHWRVLARGAQTTLVELVIDTGRKHQIRVHLQHLGHPVVGDERYGQRRAPRLCLHARQLVFPHPGTGLRLTFQAPVPALFQQLVAM